MNELTRSTSFIQVIVTTDSRELAEKIAGLMVEKKLAACGQIYGPITSIYRWQGKIENQTEWTIKLKTRRTLFATIVTEVKKVHTYQVPQVVALPIALSSSDYLEWLQESVPQPEPLG